MERNDTGNTHVDPGNGPADPGDGPMGPGNDRGGPGGGRRSHRSGYRNGRGRRAAETILRERLRAADEEIQPPPGLWARIAESAPAPGAPRSPLSYLRRRPQLMTTLFVVAALALGFGVWRLVGTGGERPAPPGPGTGLAVTVHHSDPTCEKARTDRCALRLARDPHQAYSAPGNAAGRVWNGDRLATECVITDGRLVRDRNGAPSHRWYRVTSVEGDEGWLPAVHTRDVQQVPLCPTDQT
ncbi:anti-sigma factor [Streptomyces olivaceiscleroticus]|uniref:Serine/threonine protein kinase n=1 Tax=Streptomyces olivaceiscleroticus TaxID=68245 RepID=A0ABP3J8R0_9ACTN